MEEEKGGGNQNILTLYWVLLSSFNYRDAPFALWDAAFAISTPFEKARDGIIRLSSEFTNLVLEHSLRYVVLR